MIKVMSKADFMPDFPLVKNGKTEELAALHSFKPQYVTVKVMGREQRVSMETYEKYYKHLGF